MSTRMNLTVTYLDGKEEVVATRGADQLAFERKFQIPFMAIYGDKGVFTEHLWFIGYLAAKRVHADLPEFDAWCETVDEVALTATEDTADPLDPSPQPGA